MTLDEIRTLAEESSLHGTEGGALVFHPVGKRFIVLNTPAAYVWLCLKQGLDMAAIRQELASAFALDPAEAGRWLSLAIESFETIITIGDDSYAPAPSEADAGPAPAEVVPLGRYRLLGRTIDVAASHAARPRTESLLGSLPAGEAGSGDRILIEVRGDDATFQLVCAGRLVATLGGDRLTTELEQLLLRETFPAAPQRMTFHSATAVRAGGAIVLAADSGSGKTTLGVCLPRHGWDYGGDELVLFDKAQWRAVPLPPCIKAENYARIGQWYPGLADRPEHDRYGRKVKYLPLKGNDRPHPVRSVYFPAYRPHGGSALMPVEPLEGLTLLLRQCVHTARDLGEADVADLMTWHQGVRYRSLAFDDADAACNLLDGDNVTPPRCSQRSEELF